MNHYFSIDLEPGKDDVKFRVAKKLEELKGGSVTALCSYCRVPTPGIFVWVPGSELAPLFLVPQDRLRVFFFPICQFCQTKEHLEIEVKYRALELVRTNVPLDDWPGLQYHH